MHFIKIIIALSLFLSPNVASSQSINSFKIAVVVNDQIITNFEIGVYMQRLIFYQSLNLFLVSVLAVFVQVLTNNKYFGMLLMVLYIISLFVLDNIGLENDLYQYAGRPAAPNGDRTHR